MCAELNRKRWKLYCSFGSIVSVRHVYSDGSSLSALCLSLSVCLSRSDLFVLCACTIGLSRLCVRSTVSLKTAVCIRHMRPGIQFGHSVSPYNTSINTSTKHKLTKKKEEKTHKKPLNFPWCECGDHISRKFHLFESGFLSPRFTHCFYFFSGFSIDRLVDLANRLNGTTSSFGSAHIFFDKNCCQIKYTRCEFDILCSRSIWWLLDRWSCALEHSTNWVYLYASVSATGRHTRQSGENEKET